MNKIFAIALAVVMVLSMASAFALPACATWAPAWDCTTDADLCGKAVVEVVPYVKVNTSCGWEYQVSDCATAIRSENVYFAIMLTVDAYPDPAWMAEAIVNTETTGLDLAWSYDDTTHRAPLTAAAGIDMDADEEMVYYLNTNWAWVEAEDAEFDNGSAVVFEAEVLNANVCTSDGYSVCVELTSEYDGWSNPEYNVVGDYVYGFNATVDGEYTGTFWVGNADDTTEGVNLYVTEGAILGDDRSSNAFYNQVMADFGLVNCGTAACITEDNIQANFGWDDEQEDCFNWSEKGASVVDTDCVVAIPKTGDASVLAWLF